MSSASSGTRTTPSTRQVAQDLVAGLFSLAIVAVFLGRAAGGTYLDWLFPTVLSYALGVLGIVLVIRGLMGYGDRIAAVPPLLRGKGVDVAIFTVFAVGYVALIRPVGFWIMSGLMILIGSIFLATERSPRNLVISAVVAVCVTVAAFLLLTRVFYVPLPPSPWLPIG